MADNTVKLGPASETQRKFLQCNSKFTIYGGGAGSGKSHLALMYILGFIHDPHFRAVIIRQSIPQLTQAGGLFPEAAEMYAPFGGKVRQHPQLKILFPSGAEVQFKASSGPADTKNFDGGQYSLVIFDEAQWHSIEEISYLESRIRSRAKGPHRLICTCNPLFTSPLLEFVRDYLDPDTGIPIPELSGKERYYARNEGQFVFADTYEELKKKYPRSAPQTYTFISATIYDNPIMIRNRPEYLDRLENLARVERERLLLGSWFARNAENSYFNRKWVHMVDAPPPTVTARVRAWDLASEGEPGPMSVNKNPDYTAGVKMSRDPRGNYYIEDVVRFRKTPNQVLDEIIHVAKCDGTHDCDTMIPKDTAAGGKVANAFQTKVLTEAGLTVRSAPVASGHMGKLSRFLPFASMAEAGNVYVVKGEWNESFFSELENFVPGKRTQKDD